MKNFHCLLLIFLFTEVRAFSIRTVPYRSGVATRRSILSQIKSTSESKSQSSDEAVDDYDVTCFIVNEEEIIADGEKPHVVCTSEPEEVSLFVVTSHHMLMSNSPAIAVSCDCYVHVIVYYHKVCMVQWNRPQNDD